MGADHTRRDATEVGVPRLGAAGCVLLALLVSVLAACASDGTTSLPEPDPDDPFAAVDEARAEALASADVPAGRIVSAPRPLTLRAMDWRTDPDVGGGAEEVLALLVAVDTYAADPGWNLPHAELSAQQVQAVLRDVCHVRPDSIEVLQGAAVSRDAVESAVLRLAQAARADRAMLLVYWVGHGWVEGGQPRLFTHFTSLGDEADEPTFRGTIARDELVDGWFGEAVAAARENDVALSPVLVVDACRLSVGAPSAAAPLTPLDHWELYGTRQGRFTVAPSAGPLSVDGSVRPERTRLSPFTRAFVASLERLDRAGRRVDVRNVYEETRIAMAGDDANTSRQEPELLAPLDAAVPAFVSPGPVRFYVRAVDQLENVGVDGTRVQLNSRPPVAAASAALEAAPGRHTLRVSAAGYLTRQQPVDVERIHSGRVLEVPLVPEYVRVDGRIVPPAPVTLRFVGPSAALRAGLHDVEVPADDEGRFRLRVPRLAPGLSLEVRSGDRVLASVALPERPTVYDRSDDGALWGIGRVDLGSIVLPTDASQGRLLRAAARDATGPLPLPEPWRDPALLPQPAALDEIDARSWGLVVDLAGEERWDAARASLSRLTRVLEPEVHAAWDGWIVLNLARSARDRAEIDALLADVAPSDGRLRAALHALRAAPSLAELAAGAQAADLGVLARLQRLDDEVPRGEDPHLSALRAEIRQRQITLAARLVQSLMDARRWRAVLDVLVTLGDDVPWDDDEWIAVRRQVDVAALEAELLAGLERGTSEGDWERADSALAWLDEHSAQLLGSRPRLEALRARIADEHIPLWARRLLNEAQSDYALGRLDDASAKHERLDGQLTPHYQALLDEQRQLVSRERFGVLYSEAVEHEVHGRKADAAAAYARSLRDFDQRAADALMQLGVPVDGVQLVSARGDRQHTRIGAALAAARPGDVIVVGPGTYDESLVLTGRVRLHASQRPGETGERSVTLAGPGGPALELADGADVLLTGFALRTGGAITAGRPAATVAVGASTLQLVDCTVAVADGGAAILARGTPSETPVLVLRNTAVPGGRGVALRLEPTARVELTKTRVDWSAGLAYAPFVGTLAAGSSARDSRVGEVSLDDARDDRLARLADDVAEAAARRHLSDGGALKVSARRDGHPFWARSGLTLFTSVAEALERVERDGSIEIGPGTYAEAVRPTRSVTLRGQGRPEDVILAPREGSALRLDTEVALAVRGVTLRPAAASGTAGAAPTVSVTRGRLVLSDAVVQRDSGATAIFVGASAEAVELHGCRLPAGDAPALEVEGSVPVQVSGGAWDSSEDHAWPLVSGELSAVTVEDVRMGDLRVDERVALTPEWIDTLLRPARERFTHGGRTVFVQADGTARPYWAVGNETHFATLGAALAAAVPGGTVRVVAGEYDESLVLTKPVTVQAETGARVVVRSIDASCLRVAEDVEVAVDGIVFRHEKRAVLVTPAVMVDQGRLSLTRCAVEVVGAQADLGLFHLKAVAFPEKGRSAAVVLRDTTIATDGIGIDAAGLGSTLTMHGVRIGPWSASRSQRGLWITSGVRAEVFDAVFSRCDEAVRLEDASSRLVLARPVFHECVRTLNLVSADETQVERRD